MSDIIAAKSVILVLLIKYWLHSNLLYILKSHYLKYFIIFIKDGCIGSRSTNEADAFCVCCKLYSTFCANCIAGIKHSRSCNQDFNPDQTKWPCLTFKETMYNAIKYKFSPIIHHEIQVNSVKFCYKSIRSFRPEQPCYIQLNTCNKISMYQHMFAKCAQTATYSEIPTYESVKTA